MAIMMPNTLKDIYVIHATLFYLSIFNISRCLLAIKFQVDSVDSQMGSSMIKTRLTKFRLHTLVVSQTVTLQRLDRAEAQSIQTIESEDLLLKQKRKLNRRLEKKRNKRNHDDFIIFFLFSITHFQQRTTFYCYSYSDIGARYRQQRSQWQ